MKPCDCLRKCGDDPDVSSGDAGPCMTRRAFQIADQAMFELLLCECVHEDEDGLTLAPCDESCREVRTVAEASQAIRDAYAWLQPRGYVQTSTDELGERIDVLRRPGEE